MLEELVRKTRSYRRFDQSVPVALETLRELVGLARLTASGMNMQPLKYILVCDPASNALVFEHLGWAGYLTDWPGPAEGERPAAYILIAVDTTIKARADHDVGIAAQTIMLGATEKGLGGCMIGSIRDHDGLHAELGVPAHLRFELVLALGKPAETVVIEAVGADGSIKYWRDAAGVHHVPKRSLDDLIVVVGR